MGYLGSISGSGRSPGEGNGNPLQYSSGKSHGLRSLVGYSLCGHKESDTTERLHFTLPVIALRLWQWLLIVLRNNCPSPLPCGYNLAKIPMLLYFFEVRSGYVTGWWPMRCKLKSKWEFQGFAFSYRCHAPSPPPASPLPGLSGLQTWCWRSSDHLTSKNKSHMWKMVEQKDEEPGSWRTSLESFSHLGCLLGFLLGKKN